MYKLIFPSFIIFLALAVSCGASKNDTAKAQQSHTAAKNIAYQSTDSIVVGIVKKSENEWKQLLSANEYHVMREDGTEPPYSSDLLDIKKEGVYVCGACGLPLYSSETKFESGTGWPSFYEPIAAKVVNEVEDPSLGMVRIEIECAQCGSHIGHVFNDGPEPTGLRYCMNGLALNFKEKN